MSEIKKAKTNLENELESAKQQIDAFEKNVNELTLDRMNAAPKEDIEPQTKLSSQDIKKSTEIYLKPTKSIARRDKFNEKLRKQYEFDKELVYFVAENREIIGEDIELWTGKYGGMPVEFWKVPTNKPVWGPRYLAEQIKSCSYHRLTMNQSVVTESGGYGQMYGALAVDTTVQRLDARPATKRTSVFMGASGF
jgi:hypothetical protein